MIDEAKPERRVGISLPPIGFGCSPYRDGAIIDLGSAVEMALEAGYRLLDTAELYGNERQIGEILRRLAAPPLDDVFLASKLWRTNHEYDRVIAACAASLERLGVSALDLYLMHAPQAWRHDAPLGDLSQLSLEEARTRSFPLARDGGPALVDVPLGETWSAMEELLRRGWVRAIGVSNFERTELEQLLRSAQVPPAVLEIERHPYRPRESLVGYCRRHEIAVMAHSPLSAAGLLAEPALAEMGEAHGKSAAQVVLRWNLDQGVIPLPSSLDRGHIVDNIDIFDFRLRSSDFDAIRGLAKARSPAPQ